MRCPTCENNVPDGTKFCSKCGTNIHQAVKSSNRTTTKPQTPVTSNKKSGKRMGGCLIIALAVTLFLTFIGVGGYIGYQVYQNSKNQRSSGDAWGNSDVSKQPSNNNEREDKTSATESETESSSAEHPSTEAVTPTTYTINTETTVAWAANQTSESSVPQTTAAQTEAATLPADSYDFILPNSSTQYLGSSDIDTLTSEQLRIARNEIYARHGRKFKDAGLQSYFNNQPWYIGTIEADRFNDKTMLNEIERKNLEVIKAREAILN